MKIYFIPGLGFDHRVFRNLRLADLDARYIDWIEPVNKSEDIGSYAARMANEIEEEPGGVVLVGHSFAGILCQEIACIKQTKIIILISSVKSRKELPGHFKKIVPLGMDRFFSKFLVMSTFKFWGAYQGYRSQEERELFRDMISKQSDSYLQWALRRLSSWDTPSSSLIPIIQIHGDRDKTFPVKFIDDPTHTVKNGDHFMVYKQGDVISEILLEEIGKLRQPSIIP
jgi:pimeloyl-ACP methyl ester carboxylesterase